MLERAGYRVIDANCGADAWRVLEEVRPQLVLMDVNLPDISGFDLCRRIKSRPELADVMVLHVSASRVSGTDRAVGLEVGSDGYLIEPIDEHGGSLARKRRTASARIGGGPNGSVGRRSGH